MKKRILLAITVLMVFGLAIVAFAYNKTNHTSHKASMDCCCKDGVCPMKNKDASTADTKATSCCDMPDCCCKGGGESCPMKNKGEASQKTDVDLKNVTVVTGEENCTKECCKNKKKS